MLLFGDNIRYDLLAWVVMPNHVHVVLLIKPGWTMARIVQDWKRVSTRQINTTLGLSGSLWQRDYFDRAIRYEAHLVRVVSYVHVNPVMAHLAEFPADWHFGSARFVDALDSTFMQRWPL